MPSKKPSITGSYIKRLINQEKPLTGDALEFALGLLPQDRSGPHDEVFNEIEDNFRSGKAFDKRSYAYQILVDVALLHVRLGSN
jgi:hypothetical protein